MIMVHFQGAVLLLLTTAVEGSTLLRQRKTQYFGTGATGFHPPTLSPVAASAVVSPYEEEALDASSSAVVEPMVTGLDSSVNSHMDEPRPVSAGTYDAMGNTEPLASFNDDAVAMELMTGETTTLGSELDSDYDEESASSLLMPGILPAVTEPSAVSEPTMAEQNLPTMTSMTAAANSSSRLPASGTTGVLPPVVDTVGTDDEAENVEELLDEIDNLEQEVREKDDELTQTASLLSGKFSLYNITSTAQQQWSEQEWTNKTPQELAELAEHEAEEMLQDKYVIFVIVVMSIVASAFTLFVAQQMVENPQGCTAKICRCWVAIFRILCCPLRMLCCCCGSRSSSSSISDDADRREHNRLSTGEFS